MEGMVVSGMPPVCEWSCSLTDAGVGGDGPKPRFRRRALGSPRRRIYQVPAEADTPTHSQRHPNKDLSN